MKLRRTEVLPVTRGETRVDRLSRRPGPLGPRAISASGALIDDSRRVQPLEGLAGAPGAEEGAKDNVF